MYNVFKLHSDKNTTSSTSLPLSTHDGMWIRDPQLLSVMIVKPKSEDKPTINFLLLSRLFPPTLSSCPVQSSPVPFSRLSASLLSFIPSILLLSVQCFALSSPPCHSFYPNPIDQLFLHSHYHIRSYSPSPLPQFSISFRSPLQCTVVLLEVFYGFTDNVKLQLTKQMGQDQFQVMFLQLHVALDFSREECSICIIIALIALIHFSAIFFLAS